MTVHRSPLRYGINIHRYAKCDAIPIIIFKYNKFNPFSVLKILFLMGNHYMLRVHLRTKEVHTMWTYYTHPHSVLTNVEFVFLKCQSKVSFLRTQSCGHGLKSFTLRHGNSTELRCTQLFLLIA